MGSSIVVHAPYNRWSCRSGDAQSFFSGASCRCKRWADHFMRHSRKDESSPAFRQEAAWTGPHVSEQQPDDDPPPFRDREKVPKDWFAGQFP